MKTMKFLFGLAGITLLALGLGCGEIDNGVSSDSDELVISSDLDNEETLSFELSSHDAALPNLTDADALFSVGWSKFYNPFEEEIVQRSDAFAVAPDTSLDSAVFRPHFGTGQDMGTVTLSYAGESLELLKVEMRNGSVFYNFGRRLPGNPRGMFHGDDGEVSAEIPFLAGETYRFDATGTETFPAVSVSLTAPTDALGIVSPEDGATLAGGDLEVVWQGGNTGEKLLVSLVPLMNRRAFERHGGPDGGPGGRRGGGGPVFGDNGGGFMGPRFGERHGGPHGRGPGQNPHLHLRYLVEDNTGSFTIPADDVQTLLALEGVNGVLLQVCQLITVETQDGDRTYSVQMRVSDAIRLDISE